MPIPEAEWRVILVLDSEVQAEALDTLLTERGVSHAMRSYRDSAMDGLYQAARGWGEVDAPPDRADEVKEVFKSLTEGKWGAARS